MNNSRLSRANIRGFTLIEALVAMLVMSFGMVAIAGFQGSLTRNSDLAKQRSEATRFAEQKMEQLRAYGQVDTSPSGVDHVFNYTDDVVSGPVSPASVPDVPSYATNATFTRTWTVTPNAANTEKWINVTVAWTDRTGTSQQVQLLSVISKFDPQDIGTLATGPGGSNVRKPKNRNLNIPYPAITFGNDRTKSAFRPPGNNPIFVFDNITGNIICQSNASGTATLADGMDFVPADYTCYTYPRYLLSGAVRFDTGNNPSGAEPSNTGANNETLPLSLAGPLTLDYSNSSGGVPQLDCYSQRQKVVSTTSTTPVAISSISRSGTTVTVTATNHGFVNGQTVAINATNPIEFSGAFVVTYVSNNSFSYQVPSSTTATAGSGGTAALLARITIAESDSVTGYSTVVSKLVAYVCIVTPVDHDSLTTTPMRWWGKVTINPNTVSANGTVWTLGSTSSTYKVCRYSADYNASGSISNSEHPLWYRAVTGALDGQNFLVVKGNESCPVGKPFNPLANPPIYADNTTASHQLTGELSFQCAASNCSGSNKTVLEPTTTSTDIGME